MGLAQQEDKIIMSYLTQPPKRYTFEQPKLKKWVECYCKGKVLNLFAGKVKLDVDETRVDIDNLMPSYYCCDAYEFTQFAKNSGLKYDTIVFDSPYNLRKSREKYGGRYIGKVTKIKNELADVLNPKGRIISLGYDTVGMSKSRGFRKIAICVICHNGDHNDTLCVVEEKEE
jgi:hypothetical protein